MIILWSIKIEDKKIFLLDNSGTIRIYCNSFSDAVFWYKKMSEKTS
jgi:hypothetical protein